MPTRITLQFTKQDKSSDIADNIKVVKKKHIIRDLGLNLEASENQKVLRIIQNMQLGKLDQAEAFVKIKAEFHDSEEYNDAEIRVRIGSRYRNVKWNEFEHIMGTYDITQKLHDSYRGTQKFEEVLTELVDEYYREIIKSEAI